MLIGALARHMGGVMAVLCWPTLSAYLVWQVGVGLLETLARGHLAWRTTGVKSSVLKWEPQHLKPIWKTVASLTGATWLGALTVQMDKIILSKMVSLQQFGYYTIAASVSMGMLQLIYPLVQAVLPHAVQLKGDTAGLRRLNIRLILWIITLVVCAGVVYALLGKVLLSLWLKDPAAVSATYPLLSVLLMGTALNAFYVVGYIHWLVLERVHRLLLVNAVALVLSFAIIPLLVTRLGPVGAAFGWLTINLFGFLLSLEWLKNPRNERIH